MKLDPLKFLKKRKDNYIRNWKEQENLEKYGGILFILVDRRKTKGDHRQYQLCTKDTAISIADRKIH